MATLCHLATGLLRPVSSRLLIGRGPSCSLRLDDRRVSGQHASLAWSGGAWFVRDLGSSNGTFLGTERLEVGRSERLKVGQRIGFGHTEDPWEVVDIEPPRVMAECLTTGVIVCGGDGLLGLPAEQPSIVVYADTRGQWLIEEGDEAPRRISDGGVVSLGGEPWRIRLPELMEGTAATQPGPSLDTVEMRFEVSRDEEVVQISVLHEGETIALEPREHGYVLLTLARARVDDAELAPSEQGWLDRESLLRMLGIDANALNVAIYRARGQLAAAGVEGAAGIVDVRRGRRRLGLEAARIEVKRLG